MTAETASDRSKTHLLRVIIRLSGERDMAYLLEVLTRIEELNNGTL